MSKVYMIFLFLLSEIVQLSHTQDQSLPKVHGNLFVFLNAKLKNVYKVSEDAHKANDVLMDEVLSCKDETDIIRLLSDFYQNQHQRLSR
jgi:hypothetical protein